MANKNNSGCATNSSKNAENTKSASKSTNTEIKKEFNVHKGHRKRVKERFREYGFTGFSQHEILELLLFYSIPQSDTNVIGHHLISQFGSLSNVFDADFEALKEIKGINDSSALLLKLIPALAREYISSKDNITDLRTADKCCTYFKNKFLGEKQERMRAVCLDDKLSVLACAVIDEGGPGTVPINIRKLIEFTYRNKCDRIIIAHNHPNGDAKPSDYDLHTTTYIYNTLKPVGILLLDHIIVAGNDVISLKETGAFSFLR